MTTVLVLRSGGDFEPEHANALADAIVSVGKLNPPLILTDFPADKFTHKTRRLQTPYPSWWAKMELYAPWNQDLGTIFYIDLDTVIAGPIDHLALVSVTMYPAMLLRDFVKPEYMNTGIMLLSEKIRPVVWEWWKLNPVFWMKQFLRGGDGAFIDTVLGHYARCWQDEFPNQVVSYKQHVRPIHRIPDGARVVCYHGRPRPWSDERPTRDELIAKTASSLYLKGQPQ